LCLAFSRAAFASGIQQPASCISLSQALASNQDLWGLEAMRQTNGPSYEFFAPLLPPLRYVNAAFHHYPVVLSAPGSFQKARLISNGSAINARANLKTWKESGIPISFSVGDTNEPFGQDPKRLQGPNFERSYSPVKMEYFGLGYMPVVQMQYQANGATYEQETFASVDPELATNGITFVRFGLLEGRSGLVSARIEDSGRLSESNGALLNNNSDLVVWFSRDWKWDGKALAARLKGNQSAYLAVITRPTKARPQRLELARLYEQEREKCLKSWKALLDAGTRIETPEPVVNEAWRSVLIGLYMVMKGDSMDYSHGNAYERLYQAECGDAARALLLFGHTNDAARAIPPLLHYTRDALKYHNAGFKLQMLSHYYWLTHDTNFLLKIRPEWTDEINKIVGGREKDSGLFPREQYCGDIFTPVYSLHSAGAAWRGLRDFATIVWNEPALCQSPSPPLKERRPSLTNSPTDLLNIASNLRHAILTATEKSEFKNTKPPFIPVALFGEEKPYDPLTASMRGSYWDLIAPYMLGSGMFGPGSARERAIVDYLQEHGGVFMGMIRFHQHSGLFANEDAVDDLYGLRYTLKLLQLDEPDRALVSFYGKLAHGLTRDTFIGAEGTGLRPLDEFGRPMYLPPNAASSAFFLWTLRYLLIQDWDMDDDGSPETLRLCFATPKRWLEDGKVISVANAPTCFGPLSFKIESKLKHGEVIASLDLPTRNPAKQTLLRIRVPDGWSIASARIGSREVRADSKGTVDISSFSGKQWIQFAVRNLSAR
jgi:hypothetical protein